MELQAEFGNDELRKIIDEAMIFMCACPAQVAVEIRRLRDMHRYQVECLNQPPGNAEAHHAIAQATADAHARLEACLLQVLTIEGWNRATLKMPEGLRQRRDTQIRG